MTSDQRRVIVVGAGNAALCAAMSAREQGAEVLVLEKAPEAERGGNTYFTGGGFRFPYDGMPDIQQLIPDLSAAEIARVDVGAYPAAQFRDDLARVTEGLIDDGLATQLVREAGPTLRWLRERGVRFTLMTGRQANEVDGVLVFYGGLTVEAVGAGKGLSDQEFAAAERIGVEVRYGAKVTGLLRTGVQVSGVRVWTDHGEEEVAADAVVLAAGGFEANAEMRTRYLGPGWDLAKVRGSRFNTGDAIRAALELGAQPFGHWSGAHAVAWGPQRPADRQPRRRRPLPEALLPLRHHRQSRRPAIRRRGRRRAQLHLRQVRPRNPQAARPRRLPDLRSADRRPAPR